MINENDLSHCKFKHPFTCIVAGPTGSGKTVLTRDLLENASFVTTIDSIPLKVLWCYGQWQKGYETSVKNTEIKYHEGLCDEETVSKMKPDLIVIDDLMKEVGDDPRMSALFTKVSHHLGVSVIFIVQNLFHQSKEMRTISLNSHYFVLLKNPRDNLQLQLFGRQLFPGKTTYFKDSIQEALRKPFSHVILDMTSSCPENMRIRQKINQGSDPAFLVYAPTK